MSRYIVKIRPAPPSTGLAAAVSFLLIGGLVFAYSLVLRFNPAMIAEARDVIAVLGWETAEAPSPRSLPSPPSRVVVSIDLPPPAPRAAPRIAVESAPLPMPAPRRETAKADPAPVKPKRLPPPPVPEMTQTPPEPVREAPRRVAEVPDVELETKSAIKPVTPPAAESEAPPQVAHADPKAAPRAELHADPKAPPRAAAKPERDTPPAVSIAPETPPQKPDPAPAAFARLVEAAKRGAAQARLALAQRYHAGDGVAASPLMALIWYKLAAAQGVAEAQFQLGLMHYLGDGAPKDPVLAYRWLSRAAARDHRRAGVVLGALHRSLPAPVFTALVFPEPIVLGPAPRDGAASREIEMTNIAPPAPARVASSPIRAPASLRPVAVQSEPLAAVPGESMTPEQQRRYMATASFWTPDVFVLGN